MKHINTICILLFVLLSSGLRAETEPLPKKSITIPDTSEVTVISEKKVEEKVEKKPEEQLRCEENDCVQLEFDKDSIEEELHGLMKKRAGKILVDFKGYVLPMNSKQLDGLKLFIRELSKHDGRVVVEPLHIKSRQSTPGMFAFDFLTVGYSVYKRLYTYFKFRKTRNYNAKILYHPINGYITHVFFIHRNFGDICTHLKSKCDVIEYFDDDTFDQMLSRRLKENAASGKELRVVFNKTQAHLPDSKLNMKGFRKMTSSARIYKWMFASKKVKKRNMVRKRFVGLHAFTTALDYSLKLYDLVKTAILYAPARKMKTEIQYTGTDKGGRIRTMIFSPEKK